MLQLCMRHAGALFGVRGKLAPTARLSRFYSDNMDSVTKKAKTEPATKRTKTEPATKKTKTEPATKKAKTKPATKGGQRVVDPSPVYSAAEAEATSASGEAPKKSPTGPRTQFFEDTEPVVVHDMSYPIESGKWYRIIPENFDYARVGASHVSRVPTLAHGLERVLFNPGVHYLQDPNSGVYNFNPYIRNITQPEEFDYDKLTPYITSSKDKRLLGYARGREKKFVGSTSSMTHVLSHLYFLISANKQPNLSSMSASYEMMPDNFTRGMRYPASIELRYHDGVYGIDADKSFDVKDSILSILGKSLEMLLTSEPKEFDKYKKENSWKIKDIGEENYHYVEFDEFVLRSQLDCRDDRLPRKTFDLKTRGALAVRMDLQNPEENKGYPVIYSKGQLQSFEREYYDMVRSAFLKYNFQVRIGNMDGIFVAYHNTARMFGFQYISRTEMDQVLYGNSPTGSKAFRSILVLLGKILRTATKKHPKKDLRITFDSRQPNKLRIWAEVIDDKGEEEFLKRYQEPGFLYNIRKLKNARPPPAKKAPKDPLNEAPEDPLNEAPEDPLNEAPADPLNTSDPFEPTAQKESSDTPSDSSIDTPSETSSKDSSEPSSEDAVDGYIDPEMEIFVNANESIVHYTLETFSTVNGQDTAQSVTVKSESDEWFINWRLTKSHKPQDMLAAEYRRMRLEQATYFERNAPDTPEEKLPFMLKMLRRISRQNLWRNEMPKGRAVVNRSTMPSAASSKTGHKSAAASKGPAKKQRRPLTRVVRKVSPPKKTGVAVHEGRKSSKEADKFSTEKQTNRPGKKGATGSSNPADGK